MKIAITSNGNSLGSNIDSRFGRCSYYVVYDTENKSTEFIPNPNKEDMEGAGPAAVKLLASKGVRKVVSGEFGAKVKSISDSLKVQLVILHDPGKNISQIIELLDYKR